jgi:DNA adenine methylase
VRSASPLRYPGGKWRFSHFFTNFLARNFDLPPLYLETYAGGASLALSLLFEDVVSEIWLNDLDPAIYACWWSIVHDGERFCEAIQRSPLSLDEWRRQKTIYADAPKSDKFALGFATFYLNRTNHSGILNGGVIGGQHQRGAWKLDARFNRDELIRRVERIMASRHRIKLTCRDAGALLSTLKVPKNCLVYLDPPYVGAGKALYMNSYKEADHAALRDLVIKLKRTWVVSYDDVPLIRRLYKGYRSRSVELLHTAREAKVGSEVLFFSDDSIVPRLT